MMILPGRDADHRHRFAPRRDAKIFRARQAPRFTLSRPTGASGSRASKSASSTSRPPAITLLRRGIRRDRRAARCRRASPARRGRGRAGRRRSPPTSSPRGRRAWRGRPSAISVRIMKSRWPSSPMSSGLRSSVQSAMNDGGVLVEHLGERVQILRDRALADQDRHALGELFARFRRRSSPRGRCGCAAAR